MASLTNETVTYAYSDNAILFDNYLTLFTDPEENNSCYAILD